MSLRGIRLFARLFSVLSCALVTACVTERAGEFFDVRFQYLPPVAICGDFARDIAGRTGFEISNVSVVQPDGCSAFLRDTLHPHLGVIIGTDVTRNLLFVDVWEGGFGKRPSARAIKLGDTLADAIRVRFPDAEIGPGKRFQGVFAP